MNINIIIPTFNRSAKLERILKTYSHWDVKPILHILDGSEGNHLLANKKVCKRHENVIYNSYSPKIDIIDRILDWLSNPSNPDIFFIGNDEDLFIQKYTNFALNFLLKNPSFSTVIGSYITVLKPLYGFIPQISLKKNVPLPFELKGDFLEKMSTFAYLNNSTKLPPLFYGIRRREQLLETFIKLKEFKFKYTTSELAEQIYLLKNGDIRFESLNMYIRDETRINYLPDDQRQDKETYMPSREIKKLFKSILKSDDKLYLIFHSVYFPALKVFSDKYKGSDILLAYSMPFDIKVFSSNKLINLNYKFFSRLIHKSAFFVNTFILLLSFTGKYYKLFFLFNLIFNPLKVNKLYKP